MITDKGRQELHGWFVGRLPESWFTELVEVSADREEITVIGRIAEPDLPAGASITEYEAACQGRITEFRERTRAQRVEVAREAQIRFRRQLSWGARCGHSQEMFTHISAPVMTRLKQPERLVLDTLIAGGVARSRSDALAWCVRLVERNADSWLADLRESLHEVERVRTKGPAPATEDGLEGSSLEKAEK
ncbi:hypothetical protein FH609_008490 [Streptomyces sp. 3MP-14]|uniref:Uncharacterized protein n=1 Tax=Streptomyces mimosae TaxID=2586635 RepID=A0A5N6AIP7_9ACTN|nr:MULTISPECIES: hypothetical protein [Streptomyces]KAB8168581.1 hypothetical protein FH607_004875 [Streptomyces mimosae]KAB8178138.1 hypothetical protein FH609_008490 [Streptomyces sp. 3MP-14]